VSIHATTLKYVSLDIGGNEFRAQIRTWRLTDDTDEPDKIHTFGPDGQNEDTEEATPSWNLELEFFSDWRTPTGLNHYCWSNHGTVAEFTIHHNLGTAGSDPVFTGEVKIKRTSVGGEVRTKEVTELTLPIVGEPDYAPAA
jgi:hypothetical protein